MVVVGRAALLTEGDNSRPVASDSVAGNGFANAKSDAAVSLETGEHDFTSEKLFDLAAADSPSDPNLKFLGSESCGSLTELDYARVRGTLPWVLPSRKHICGTMGNGRQLTLVCRPSAELPRNIICFCLT